MKKPQNRYSKYRIGLQGIEYREWISRGRSTDSENGLSIG